MTKPDYEIYPGQFVYKTDTILVLTIWDAWAGSKQMRILVCAWRGKEGLAGLHHQSLQ